MRVIHNFYNLLFNNKSNMIKDIHETEDIYLIIKKKLLLCFYFDSSLWVRIKSRNLASPTTVKIFTKPLYRQRTWQKRFRVVIVIWVMPPFYIWTSKGLGGDSINWLQSLFWSYPALSGCWVILHYMKAGVRLERPHNLWTGTGCS